MPAGAGRARLKALCGGEALPVALADRLVAAGLELWNMYGPTETTIWSTCTRVEHRRVSAHDRPADRQHHDLHPRRGTAARARRRGRRALDRRRRPGARLPGPARPDRRSASSPTRSSHGRARGSTAPAISARYRADGADRVPGPHRQPGQGPRLPDRARRDRDRPHPAREHLGGGRRGRAAPTAPRRSWRPT